MEKQVKKQTLLVGEGVHQHTLYGNFNVETTKTDFPKISVKGKSELKHEKPNGSWSDEHKTLLIDKGNWVMGKQVEYNPWSRDISRVFD
jgi:hypothetical protein